MKKRISIQIEETITETSIVLPGNISCPACGMRFTLSRRDAGDVRFKRPGIETISIKPENVKLLDSAKE